MLSVILKIVERAKHGCFQTYDLNTSVIDNGSILILIQLECQAETFQIRNVFDSAVTFRWRARAQFARSHRLL